MVTNRAIVVFSILVLVIVLTSFYYYSQQKPLVIDDKVRLATKYDTWELYDNAKAKSPPNGKSRSVMLLHAYVPFWNAGSEVCAHTVNRLLVQRGHEVWVGAPGYPNKMYEGVHLFNSNDKQYLNDLMVHTQVLSTHSFRDRCLKLKDRFGIAFIDWFHGGTYTANAKIAGARNGDPRYWAVFNSNSLLESFSEIQNKKYFILKPPVDWREYQITKEEQKPEYVTLSNLNENKGGHILIDIAKAAPEIKFLGVRGSYWKQIEDPTVTNITYIDNTPKIKEVYAQTKILIMPSKDETWGRTAVEAMASGIPVIAAPTPGLKECCQDSALFVERSNIEEWVRLIRRLINDKSFYDEYSYRGKVRARQLEPTHDMEMFMEWYETKVVPSADHSTAISPNLYEKFLDYM